MSAALDRATERRVLMGVALAGVLGGGLAPILGLPQAARAAWFTTTLVVAVPLCIDVARRFKRRDPGVDAIALLAMLAALAVGEFLAAAVVALMVAGGSALEEYAGARARRDLSALLDRSPRTAHRYELGALVQVDVADVRPH
jgi:cation transport ATPase